MVPEASPSPGPATTTLGLERKLKMYEAREAILSRIGSETFSVMKSAR